MALVEVKEILNKFVEKESEEHVSTYNNVALTAKAEGYSDIEAMLCAYAEEEKNIAETARKVLELLSVKEVLSKFAEKENAEHVAEYNKVALTAKAEGYSDIEAMLCAYAEQEEDIARTARKVAGAL
ncbi:hypothetical protein [Sulfurisphaera ohwakuensis]|uniref:Rubrerythrin n=1 Tax=Sulfurisphaera ohwakuensis TaxID=69656 RepID=A0A650CJ35_SULOH|nr:hypothetical protein [Sulfurisphaera ohwakuensis]MBB5253423.1 rubrerythrin [Sulfurisphaera ohwakuensis]QGR17738.1 hypothetical protein D1869_11545 [Sulfurisphaera ohwakuensis]